MLPEAAAFYTSVVHGEELTPAQRLLLERRSLNEMKERFRVAGRYPPPVFDRRLPSCLLLARESEEGPILGCAGLELALVDDEKRIVLRRSRSEALLRERLDEGGAEAGAQAGGGASISPASGRRFHRPLLPDEMDEETAALRLQASWHSPWRCLLWLHLLWPCLLWPLRGSCRRALVTAWLVVGRGRRLGHGARGRRGQGGRRWWWWWGDPPQHTPSGPYPPHTQPAPAQEAALEREGGERACLALELSAAAASLPRSLRLLPLCLGSTLTLTLTLALTLTRLRLVPQLSCVAVARGHRRRGVARELCLALQAEAGPWGRVS